MWAALDCPSYTPEIWDAQRPSLLAGLAAELIEPVRLGEPVVAVGWPLGTEGRKHRSAPALLGARWPAPRPRPGALHPPPPDVVAPLARAARR